jgi:hypothetical protein
VVIGVQRVDDLVGLAVTRPLGREDGAPLGRPDAVTAAHPEEDRLDLTGLHVNSLDGRILTIEIAALNAPTATK